MAQIRAVCRKALPSLAVLAVAALLGSAPAVAQAERSAPPAVDAKAAICLVQASETFASVMGTAKPVLAICGGHGLMLGHADTFTAIPNPELNAVLVDLRRGAGRRVLLISLQGDGVPLLEDLSGQIAMGAGKGPMSSLEGVEIDVAGFAQNGAIGVRGRPEDNGGSAKTGAIALGQQIAQTRSSRAVAPASN